MNFLERLFSTDGFMPHGMCYLWNPAVIWLHVISDGLIALAYYSIPLTLVYFVRKRKDLAFDWIFLCFAVFIVACGTTHLLEIWNIWHPAYWLSGIVKAVTAFVSIGTAILLIRLVPKALALPSPAQLQKSNDALTETSALFETLLKNTTDHIYFKDRESRAVRFSQEYMKHLNQTNPDDLKGKTDFDFFTEQHARPAFETEQEILRTGRPILNLEEKETHLDGRVTWVLTSKVPWYDQKGNIVGTWGISKDITARKKAEEALKLSEERSRTIIESAQDAFISINDEGRIQDWNRQAEIIFGWPREEAMGRLLHETIIPKNYREGHLQGLRHLRATGEGAVLNRCVELVALRRDGHEFPVEIIIWPLQMENEVTYNAFVRDITERKRSEAQLFQAQKIETVGKLAGGIAHEFNSILTAILGQSEMLINDLPPGNPFASATEIRKAANRAATLTHQLLAFGRKQILQPETLDLNQVVASMTEMIRQLMGANVEVSFIPAADLKVVNADVGQIEQVILSLAINAHEAMRKGGKFTIKTSNVTLDHELTGHVPELKPGEYVRLTMTDTGPGMSPEVKAHLFEPFFSTKDIGQGTGLGLATCYGILKQSGGHISAQSEPGQGTTFTIYLPQAQEKPKSQSSQLPELPRGNETILLVEDDPALLKMAELLLERLGYIVLSAADGMEALSIMKQQDRQRVDLVLTDLVMPQMNGKDLADQIKTLHPETKVLFTTGYNEKDIAEQGISEAEMALLPKPFTPSALAHKVREVLDGTSG